MSEASEATLSRRPRGRSSSAASLTPERGTLFALPAAPVSNRERLPLWTPITPTLPWDRILLPPDTANSIERFAREFRARDAIRAAGLRIANRIAFVGPPGWGKTITAAALGELCGVPCVKVHMSRVWNSYMGETAKNVDAIFEHLGDRPAVVLFDEFDSLAQSRQRDGDVGETRRVVNCLLQAIDELPPNLITVACSNFAEAWDSAMWRRFDLVERIGPAFEYNDRTRFEWTDFEDQAFRSILGAAIEVSHDTDAEQLGTIASWARGSNWSLADCSRFVAAVRRRAVVAGSKVSAAMLEDAFKDEWRRKRVIQG